MPSKLRGSQLTPNIVGLNGPDALQPSSANKARRVAKNWLKQGVKRFLQRATTHLHDTLTVPDLASAEASFERSRLLLASGPNVAAMGIDASDTIQARNSLEKMLAHQLTATHAVVMEQIGQVHVREEGSGSAKRLTAIARCLEAYQHGLLTLKKLRQNGSQRIVVQYVNVNEGAQAVIGNLNRGSGESPL